MPLLKHFLTRRKNVMRDIQCLLSWPLNVTYMGATHMRARTHTLVFILCFIAVPPVCQDVGLIVIAHCRVT
jgi:hypothetical protein